MALAVGQPGDVVIATRAVHRSLLLGFVLAGLTPVWVQPEIDDVSGLPGGVPARAARGGAGRPPRGPRRLRGGAGLRRRALGRRGARAYGARGRRPARRRPGVGRPPRLPPRPAAARARLRCGRLRDERAQGAARLHAGRAGPGPDRAARPGPAGPGVRGDPHDEPVGHDRREHRRGARAAGQGRRAAARPDDRASSRRLGSGCAVSRASPCSTVRPTSVDPTRLVVGLAGTGRRWPRRRGRPGRAGLRRRDGRPRHDRRHGDDGGHRRTRSDRSWTRCVASVEGAGPTPREVVRAVWLGEGSTPEAALDAAGRVLRPARDGAAPSGRPAGWPPSSWPRTPPGSRRSCPARCSPPRCSTRCGRRPRAGCGWRTPPTRRWPPSRWSRAPGRARRARWSRYASRPVRPVAGCSGTPGRCAPTRCAS